MLANSAHRVDDQTSEFVNQRIHACTRKSINYYTNHPGEIDARLEKLDAEWDIERALETGSSILSLTGLLLGITRSRRWLVLPLAVQSFFLQHALQGWCPPLPLLRRLGFRTALEIDDERCALEKIIEHEHHIKPSSRSAQPTTAPGDITDPAQIADGS